MWAHGASVTLLSVCSPETSLGKRSEDYTTWQGNQDLGQREVWAGKGSKSELL